MDEKITKDQIQKWRDRWKGKNGVIDELIMILQGDKKIEPNNNAELYERLKNANDFLKKSIDNYEEKIVKWTVQVFSLDLRGINLLGRTICGIDFTFARLQASFFRDSTLNDITCYFTDLREARFEMSTLINVTFSRTYLQGASFCDTRKVCNVNFGTAFVEGTKFIDMDLTSCSFKDAAFGKEIVSIELGPTERSTYFKNCRFLPLWRDHFFTEIKLPSIKKLFKFEFKKFFDIKIKLKKPNLISIWNHLTVPWFYTDFYGVNIDDADTTMAPDLYKYVKDQQYLYRFKEKHPHWYCLWRGSCGCGNNIFLWLFWCLVLIGFLGAINADYYIPAYMPNFVADFIDSINPIVSYTVEKPVLNCFSPYYYSFISFFTLGFGNLTLPENFAGRVWIMLELAISYLMLGGLLSIFSNKLARRSG
ncbi:pentapeptide repeat-containing protein [bacterium]|nr:pentapeptide repeat-containing protein [FCB group bacterium]MBL7190562.1 pentapeptide repeat-containing protein [bacterium]